MLPQDAYHHRITDPTPTSDPQSIRYEVTLKDIEPFPDLHVLSLYANERSGSFSRGLYPIASRFQSLTHLQLWSLFSPNHREEPLNFCSLQTLSIEYDLGLYRQPEEYPYPYFSVWNLPFLIYLDISGSFISTSLGYEEDIAPFLRKVAPNLRGLSLDVQAISRGNSDHPSFPSEVLVHCTELKTLCIKLSKIDIVPSSIMPSIWIIFLDFELRWRFHLDEDTFIHIYRAREWNVAGFGMPISWYELERILKDKSHWNHSQCVAFVCRVFEMIQWGDHIFTDRNGLNLENEQVREVIDKLYAYISTDECREQMEWDSKNYLCYYMWPSKGGGEESEAEFTDEDDRSEIDGSEEVKLDEGKATIALTYDLGDDESDDSYEPEAMRREYRSDTIWV
ncbi:hypothetical protein CPB86DRAFT_817795 [Serendipita vermifera]|nr:hypothetical protein CPB86DRAFT_817795 [Serendipita vermifera]